MNTCPHCRAPIAWARRLATPGKIRCPACTGLSTVAVPGKLMRAYAAAQVVVIPAFIWLGLHRSGWVVLLAVGATLGGLVVLRWGPLVPKAA